jgi:hypothetical protein
MLGTQQNRPRLSLRAAQHHRRLWLSTNLYFALDAIGDHAFPKPCHHIASITFFYDMVFALLQQDVSQWIGRIVERHPNTWPVCRMTT